ncbi:MAG: hypothetical protein H0W50_06275 [Parachlamydiaceae bacterium]|nr:hypothetical protein [Parachlamydiaceae bacterium]
MNVNNHGSQQQNNQSYNNLLQRQAEEIAMKTAKLEKKHELERKVASTFYEKENNPDLGIYMPFNVYEQKVSALGVTKYLFERGICKYAKDFGIPLACSAVTFVALPIISGATAAAKGICGVLNGIWNFYKKIVEWAWDPTVHKRGQCVDDDGVKMFDLEGNPIMSSTCNRETTTIFMIFGGAILVKNIGQAVVDIFHKYQNTQSLTKIVFEDFYDWQHTKINEIRITFSIPVQMKGDQVISRYKCAISKQPTAFPYRDAQGHLFEHAQIVNHLVHFSTCPVNGHPLETKTLFFDCLTYEIIRGRIDELSSK